MKRNLGLGAAVGLLFCLLALALVTFTVDTAQAQSQGRQVTEPSPTAGNVPGESQGSASDSAFWREIRKGVPGNVSIPDKQAAQMIQSEGEGWRAFRNGPLTVVGIWALCISVVLIALFFALRGRIKIDAGPSGKTIERFNEVERFAHWLTAVCFIILAITGLNLLYGKHVLLPVLGPEIFATISMGGKYAHNYLAFGFMLGIVMMFVLWVRHNLPNKYDLKWLAQGGGLFVKGVHPPSRKFNAGQKLIFWSVILLGGSLAVTGVALLFPYTLSMFDGTFAFLQKLGIDYFPTGLTPLAEMQYAALWHAVVGIALIAIVIAHIYIGSIGMEGAFDAMGSGQVDENWAREHHNIWVAEVKGEPIPTAGDHGPPKAQPAE